MTKAITPPQTDLPRIDLAVPRDRPVAGAAHRSPVQRRRWTPLRTLALAADFVLAARGLFSRLYLIHSSFGMTFADVLQRIQKAQSVTYKQKVQVDGQEPREMQYMAMYPGRLRTVMPERAKCISRTLPTAERRISIRSKDRPPDTHGTTRQAAARAYLEWVTTLHETDGVFVGQQDHRRAQDKCLPHQPTVRARSTVWADVQTDLPVRLERVLSPCLDKDIKVPDLSLFCAVTSRTLEAAQVSSPHRHRAGATAGYM